MNFKLILFSMNKMYFKNFFYNSEINGYVYILITATIKNIRFINKKNSFVMMLFLGGCGLIPQKPHVEINDSLKKIISLGVSKDKTRYVICGGTYVAYADGYSFGKNLQFGPLVITSKQFSIEINIEESAVIDISEDIDVNILDKKSNNKTSFTLSNKNGKIFTVPIDFTSEYLSSSGFWSGTTFISSYSGYKSQITATVLEKNLNCAGKKIVHYQ